MDAQIDGAYQDNCARSRGCELSGRSSVRSHHRSTRLRPPCPGRSSAIRQDQDLSEWERSAVSFVFTNCMRLFLLFGIHVIGRKVKLEFSKSETSILRKVDNDYPHTHFCHPHTPDIGTYKANISDNAQFSALRSVLCALIKFANQKMTRVFHNADRPECQICHLPVSYYFYIFPLFI